MRKVVDGKIYDTNTADHICDLESEGECASDWRWEDTSLYRTKKGAYFLAGEGSALSRWGKSLGGGRRDCGEGIQVLDEDEAREIAEEAGLSPKKMIAAGFVLEDA